MVLLECKAEQPGCPQTAKGANKRLVLHVRLKCGFQSNVGHFGHRHFGLGPFGPDILATDVLATENAKGGRFSHNRP